MSTKFMSIDLVAAIAVAKGDISPNNARLILNERDELVEALRDTLSMLKAAHMHLNMPHDINKRVVKAREVLARATLAASDRSEARP